MYSCWQTDRTTPSYNASCVKIYNSTNSLGLQKNLCKTLDHLNSSAVKWLQMHPGANPTIFEFTATTPAREFFNRRKIIFNLKTRHAINSAVNFYNAGVVTRDRRIGSWLQNTALRRSYVMITWSGSLKQHWRLHFPNYKKTHSWLSYTVHFQVYAYA
jgi:hypothetical protein